MTHSPILFPLVTQVLLTLVVWIWLYVTRLGTMWRNGIDPQDLADESKAQKLLAGVVNPSDNFENLFELPVLFYVAVLVILQLGIDDPWFTGLAWGFVGLRGIHSVVHCTYNRIIHRFTAYFLSSLALWGIWLRLVWSL